MVEINPEETRLALVGAAEQALAEAKTIPEVKLIRDKAEAIRLFAAQQKGSLNLQNQAAELKLQAERRLGEMLGPPEQGKRTDLTSSKLEEVAIPDASAHRWRVEAAVPEVDFQRYVATQRDKSAEITSRDLYMMGRRLQVPEPVSTPPLPEGEYRCIVVDPPWPVAKIEREVRPNQGTTLDYPSMSLEEIEGLDLPDFASDGCWMFLWTTQRFLVDAANIMVAWGVPRIFTMIWCKPGGFQPQGLAQYDCEFIHVGRSGPIPFVDTKDFSCWFQAPRGKHSEKPDEFYRLIARVTAEPRLDMFARRPREGFALWGAEANAEKPK